MVRMILKFFLTFLDSVFRIQLLEKHQRVKPSSKPIDPLYEVVMSTRPPVDYRNTTGKVDSWL